MICSMYGMDSVPEQDRKEVLSGPRQRRYDEFYSNLILYMTITLCSSVLALKELLSYLAPELNPFHTYYRSFSPISFLSPSRFAPINSSTLIPFAILSSPLLSSLFLSSPFPSSSLFVLSHHFSLHFLCSLLYSSLLLYVFFLPNHSISSPCNFVI